MAHRSNQAVASQEQPGPQTPDDPPPARRLLVGWTTALLALGVSTAALALAIWLLRFPIASFFIEAALAERGTEADFQIVTLDLDRAVVANVRFGSETSPDAEIRSVEALWRWSGLSPHLTGVRVASPRLRLRIDPAGRVSAGSLDRLGRGPPGGRRPSLPEIGVEISDGALTVEAPFGQLAGEFAGAGVLGRDFTATATIEETSSGDDAHSLDRGQAELVVVSREGSVAARVNATVHGLVWGESMLREAQLRLMARAPLSLARYEAEAAWRAEELRAPSLSGARLNGGASIEAIAREDSLTPRAWQGQVRANAAVLTLASNTIQRLRADVRADGRESNGQGHWTLFGERFDGLAMISERPSAAGRFAFDLRGDETLHSQAQISFARTRLNDRAQQRLRSALPDLPTAPVGPTFARAERAVDIAADRFDLTVPIIFNADERGAYLRATAPAEARAASGAVLRLSPLREDTPALTVQWPGTNVHGAVALELNGGGAPAASLLLDSLDWSPGAPFEADGTLTLADWRADGAEIAADELVVGISVSPQGEGRVDLRGPARVTGPLGEGEVRNMVANLDIGVAWSPGWRVVANRGCLPIEMGRIDAAGLSFSNGAFALCALDGALIAADASNNLSGGFTIRSLGLNGRLAGEQGQPARLGAASVTGRFRGRTGDVVLALDADAPRLRVDMAEDRTLAIDLASASANAHIANNTWSIEGDFREGTLADPSLPGTVTTIEGRWSAAPEDGEPVIRIVAGEALLTANRPASEDERTLFNPLRLVETNATLRDGRIDADGAILLEERRRQLARFTAHHDVSDGAGSARIIAPAIVFDQSLQPYFITERARGMVENVRGSAAATANVVWSRDDLAATGTLSTDGVSFATATMPVVQNVRGSIFFDDLFNLTTPPGQEATIGLLNPGLAVRNGQVRFQLLQDQRVTIERAAFEFAGGVLEMTPTTVRLGEDETSIELTLRDVDAAELIANLEIPDLTATGRIEGSFPLLLTRRTAYVRHGVLRAQGEGGTISYTGSAGGDAAGPARIAFDALRSFRYDALVLTLDGDINGEVVSAIEFSGRNAGGAVDLGDITPVPGVGRVTVRGVPFDFNVHLTAPFRALARTAASITDPGIIINRANGNLDDEDADEAVDRGAPGTR